MSSNIPSRVPKSGIPKPPSQAGGSTAQQTGPTPAPSQHVPAGSTTTRAAPPQPVASKEKVEPTVVVPQKSKMDPQTKQEPQTDLAELVAKYKQDIEALTESTEMATIEKEIAEEKLDTCERELQELRDKLAEATLKIDLLTKEQQDNNLAGGAGVAEPTVTVYQLQKVEEQNELLKQALVKLRDISAKDKKTLEDLQIENEELQEKLLDLEEKEHKFLEQIKIYEEQIDVSQSAQEMVEKLTQQKADLEDKLREMVDDLDCMNKLRDLDEQLIQTARETEIDLTNENDKLRVQLVELGKRARDMEDYLSEQERSMGKLKDENRSLSDQISRLKDQFKEGESLEQHKHQIENVAYKLNFSESKMAEKEAEIARYKRNLAEVEEQMNSLSMITKEQAARIDELKAQYDTKISENSELQRALKKKMEEVSELEIRREMAEKKLQSIQVEMETKVTNLNRTIDTMKGIEVQHEEDIKRLMEDNELIERERRELRDQLNKSNRSLERSMQTGNMSMASVHDSSLASLGINFQTPPSTSHHTSSPYQQASSHQLNQSFNLHQQQTILPTQVAAAASLGSARHVSLGSEADDSIFLGKIKDLSAAFDHVNRKNYELEMDLALRELNSRIPPYNGSNNLATFYDLDQAKTIRAEAQKLKREIRLAMINQQICPKSRNIHSHLKNENYKNSMLASRYKSLENQANALMSQSSLTRMRPYFPPTESVS